MNQKLFLATSVLLALTGCASTGSGDTHTINTPAPVNVVASSHDGNLPTQVLDGDFKTRWSANGQGETMTFDYGQEVAFDAVKLGFHKGDERATKFSIEVSQDGTHWDTVVSHAQSTGKSLNLERFDFPEVSARYIKYVGEGNTESDWNSVSEFIGVNCQTDYCSNEELPREDILVPVEITSSSHDGNGPDRLFDNDLNTRWSSNGVGEWAMYDYGSVQTFDAVRLAFHNGEQRQSMFDIQVSTDGVEWQTVLEGAASSGRVKGYERFAIDPIDARYVRYMGQGNSSSSWNSVTEFQALNCVINSCPENHIITDAVVKAEKAALAKELADGGDAEAQRMEALRSGDFGVRVPLPCDSGCDWDVPLKVPTLPPVPLPGNKPSENFDMTTWYLSQPFDHDKDGKPDDVREWDLANGYEHPEIFYTADDGGLVFKTYIKGVRTSANTKFARTELREMLRAGDKSIATQGVNKNNWVFSSAPIADQKAAAAIDGVLEATLKIDHTTTTGEANEVGRFIIGQIHDKDDEPIRLYYRKLPHLDTGTVYFAHENTIKGSDTFYDLVGGMTGETDDGIALGEVFSYRIEVVGNTMTVTVMREGRPDAVQVVDMSESGYDTGGKYMYFKAGVYNQNITGDPDDYVQATFYKLEKSHSQYVE